MQDEVETTCRELSDRLQRKSLAGQFETSAAWRFCMIASENPPRAEWLAPQGDRTALQKGLIAFSSKDYEQACQFLRPYNSGSLGALSLLVRAISHHEVGEHAKASEELVKARKILSEESPHPTRPLEGCYAGYTNSMRWCEPLALLPIAERKIEGKLSSLGQLLVNLKQP